MKEVISEIDTKSRLAGAINFDTYQEAESYLNKLRILLVYNPTACANAGMQAAILTAVNAGKRCFKGGVDVYSHSDDENKMFFWKEEHTFKNEIIKTGAKILKAYSVDEYDFILYFGLKNIEINSLEVIANSWHGGITTLGYKLVSKEASLPMGGIAAGSMAIGKAFLFCSTGNTSATEDTIVNLWDLSQLECTSDIPLMKYFPEKLWLLGLGHLGQAYVWALSMLPISIVRSMSLTLQDTDYASISNWESSLLTELSNVGQKKTRVVSTWIEQLGTSTTLIERKFDNTFRRQESEPLILVCGLDNAEGRLGINHADYSLILDCGLGGDMSTYDNLKIHVFPNLQITPDNIWDNNTGSGPVSDNLSKMYQKAFKCGYTDKGISTSFVGAFSSAFIVSELLKGLNQGKKTNIISLGIRDLKDSLFVSRNNNYSTELRNVAYIKMD